MEKLAKQQACQLFIEQEIEKGLSSGKTTYAIGKEVAQWIQKLFEVKINPKTIDSKARRMKEVSSNEEMDSTQGNDNEIEEIQEIKIEHGGARDGAGRPPKFSVKPEGGDWYQSSESPEWETPQWLFDLLDKEFCFEIDVCASLKIHKCDKYFSKIDNGLEKDWPKSCWMNPPYGREISEWMRKARVESENGSIVVCLVPARPDTEWWWENCIQGEIRFIRGRLQWPGSDTAAPFPSAVVILGPKIKSKVVWWDVQSKRK